MKRKKDSTKKQAKKQAQGPDARKPWLDFLRTFGIAPDSELGTEVLRRAEACGYSTGAASAMSNEELRATLGKEIAQCEETSRYNAQVQAEMERRGLLVRPN